MTVKELLKVIPDTQNVEILNSYGCVFKLDRKDHLTIAAFNDFVVSDVEARDKDSIEIALKLVPIKE